MATVFIPSLMQTLTGGQQTVEVPGSTVREIVNNLEEQFPGTKDRLVDKFRMKPNISVAIDAEVTPMGLLEKVGENSEVHFIPAIGGGSLYAIQRTVGAVPNLPFSSHLDKNPLPGARR